MSKSSVHYPTALNVKDDDSIGWRLNGLQLCHKTVMPPLFVTHVTPNTQRLVANMAFGPSNIDTLASVAPPTFLTHGLARLHVLVVAFLVQKGRLAAMEALK